MRLIIVVIAMALTVLWLYQPGIPGKVTVIQAGQVHEGWSSDGGKIVVTNPRGRTIMYGEVSRTGGIELMSTLTEETYVGHLNPMGRGRLMSPRTGSTLRVDVER
jgi:hypothetical protein